MQRPADSDGSVEVPVRVSAGVAILGDHAQVLGSGAKLPLKPPRLESQQPNPWASQLEVSRDEGDPKHLWKQREEVANVERLEQHEADADQRKDVPSHRNAPEVRSSPSVGQPVADPDDGAHDPSAS